MAYILAPGIHVAHVEGCAIILDTLADRYRKLNPALTEALSDCLQGTVNPGGAAGVEVLRKHRIIAEAERPVPPPGIMTKSPIESLVELGGHVEAISAFTAGYALAAARIRLHRSGLADTLALARGRAARATIIDPTRSAALARGFRKARSWLPFQRACLPDSIALHALLCRHRLRSSLVIGVRDHPFNAHCWVQSESIVLTDPLDEIRALTPILSL